MASAVFLRNNEQPQRADHLRRPLRWQAFWSLLERERLTPRSGSGLRAPRTKKTIFGVWGVPPQKEEGPPKILDGGSVVAWYGTIPTIGMVLLSIVKRKKERFKEHPHFNFNSFSERDAYLVRTYLSLEDGRATNRYNTINIMDHTILRACVHILLCAFPTSCKGTILILLWQGQRNN